MEIFDWWILGMEVDLEWLEGGMWKVEKEDWRRRRRREGNRRSKCLERNKVREDLKNYLKINWFSWIWFDEDLVSLNFKYEILSDIFLN